MSRRVSHALHHIHNFVTHRRTNTRWQAVARYGHLNQGPGDPVVKALVALEATLHSLHYDIAGSRACNTLPCTRDCLYHRNHRARWWLAVCLTHLSCTRYHYCSSLQQPRTAANAQACPHAVGHRTSILQANVQCHCSRGPPIGRPQGMAKALQYSALSGITTHANLQYHSLLCTAHMLLVSRSPDSLYTHTAITSRQQTTPNSCTAGINQTVPDNIPPLSLV